VTSDRAALAALAASAFVYVTAETIPVGLLPQIAEGLSVTEADVGLLLTSYAVVAGLTTIPLTAITMRVPRHLLLAATVAVFAVSQLAAALARTFAMLLLARLICALAHGVFWSTIAPVAARLAPVGRAGKATALVFLGNSLAIVLGVPLGTAVGQWLGWRVAIGVLAAAGVLCVAVLLVVLLWGGAFTATPVCLQAAILRVAPHARDAASAVYVVAFQIGIGGGALLGERFVRAGQLAALPAVAAVLALAAGVIVLASREAFPREASRAAV
jgi:predicted MFS family arabinose efflux permease